MRCFSSLLLAITHIYIFFWSFLKILYDTYHFMITNTSVIFLGTTKGEDSLGFFLDFCYTFTHISLVSRVTSLSMSPVDDTFISGSLDKTIRLWDLRSPNCQARYIL